ncbi:phenylacetate--CoA ligase family protein [Kitasatospora sp. NPDC101235]|uniref:phenylacetate--CoA ligase family protein n=1 Tax=Kitasatospora sp. NPDC101235 TaxID=3364101 RepID=UPI003817C70A
MPDRRYFDRGAETVPREELLAHQEQRVLELVSRAYEFSSFYRELWDAHGVHPRRIRTIEDFRRRIPFITKDQVRSHRARTGDPFGGLLCVDRADLTSVTSSSGTTGVPSFFAEVWDECPPLPAGTVRDLWELGLRPGDRVLSQPGTIRNLLDFSYHALGLTVICIDSGPGRMADVLDAVRRHRPAYIQLTYAQVVELSHLAGEHDLREVFSCLKGVAFAGLPLSPRMRRTVREDWGIELFEYTSAADTGTAWECREHAGFHLWEDMVLAECLEPDGDEEVAAGEIGELVATDLDNPVSPLIRYRSEDLVRMDRSRCGCGRTHSRMRVVGRRGDETLVRGRPVTLHDIGRAVEAQPESAGGMFQIVRPQRDVETLVVRVGYVPVADTRESDLHDRLVAGIHAHTGVTPVLELRTEEELMAASSGVGKLTRVVRS